MHTVARKHPPKALLLLSRVRAHRTRMWDRAGDCNR